MPVALLSAPDSAYYWALVVAITVAFALIDLEAFRRNRWTRWHAFSVWVYAGAWVIVLGVALPIGQGATGWWVFPAAVRVAVIAIFWGGQLLAEGVRGEQWMAHPEQREPPVPPPRISEDELRAAEEYDAQWQLEDRARNHERALHEREDREHRTHARRSGR
jgi:hypothetical protein